MNLVDCGHGELEIDGILAESELFGILDREVESHAGRVRIQIRTQDLTTIGTYPASDQIFRAVVHAVNGQYTRITISPSFA